MFRAIRKKRNEISIDDSKNLLAESRRGVLAVNGDDGYPYAVPINYYYDGEKGKIYFHGSRAGHKVDALNKCDRICFTVIGPETAEKEAWAPFVKSVVVFGRCRQIEDPATAEECLRKFAMKYYPDEESVNEEISVSGKAVRMYEIEIEHLSGKKVQEK